MLALNSLAAFFLFGLAIKTAPLALLVTGFVLLGLSVLITAIVGRALFYVLVIPTTMPGALFWRNKSFEQHARDIGLARLPQVGVAEHGH